MFPIVEVEIVELDTFWDLEEDLEKYSGDDSDEDSEEDCD